MKITEIQVENFKRFTDLTIQDIPESSKLVLLIGSNGSGKSSVFDAFNLMAAAVKRDTADNAAFWDYFKKKEDALASVKIQFEDSNKYVITDENYSKKPKLSANAFYGRTSFRQIPRLTRMALGQGGAVDFEKDSDRPRFFIDRDNRFENDLEKITETVLKEFFLSNKSNVIKEKFIEPINRAFGNIFGSENGTKLQLVAIIPPLDGKAAQITFHKGVSVFHYNYLSAGEKEIFNIVINFLSRSSLYQDTIYYIDEMDVHLNTQLQFNLLKEITENWIPENCQLWTASHSLGFIEYAKQSEHASIIDFDNLDFDLPRVLSPQPKDNPDIYEIAVGKEFLPALFKHMNIYFVENNDRDYYATVGIAKSIFVKGNNRNSVYYRAKSALAKGIVDRDFLTDDDIKTITKQYPNLHILAYYSIENYMYHPDNLAEYCLKKNIPFDKKSYIQTLTDAKNQVKDALILQIVLARSSYPYFEEPEFNNQPVQDRFKAKQENYEQSATIQSNLNSDELEIFYKSLPMKSYCTNLPQRQNIAKSELVKTQWFKSQIEKILNNGK